MGGKRDNRARQWLAHAHQVPKYHVLEEKNNLQLSIRCASDSYNFDMHASATLASNAISGSWNEMEPERRRENFRHGGGRSH